MPDVKIVVDRASKLFLEGSVVAFRNVDLQIKTQEVLCVVGPSGCGKTAFRNVDLQIRSKEVVCVVGPSGCGKTTLLRCIGGLLAPIQDKF